jgi:SAM-dependent methyltransferase
MDWGVGRYEHVAAQLQPAAEAVVERCRPRPGEHVVDLGCGTGNAALLVARRGARVTGVDPAARLVAVARADAAAQGLAAEFVPGRAEAAPLPDGAADAVVSVFGLIFCAEPPAAAELSRVLGPGGRVVFSAWVPSGPIGRQAVLPRDAVAAAGGAPAGPPPFAWQDAEAVYRLLAPHGFSIEVEERSLPFTGASVLAFVDSELEHHPAWVEARGVLEPRGTWSAVRDEVIALFGDANEDPAAFSVSSRYVITTATR